LINAKIDKKSLAMLDKKLTRLKQLSKQGFSNEIGKTAFEIVSLSKKAAPAPTGNLRNLIGLQKSGTNTIEVFSKAPYSPYVEFGTGARVDLADMLELGIPAEYAAQFKGKGIKEVNLPARPYFYSSARKGLQNLLLRLDSAIKKAKK
jgi:hypothetical protein